MSEKQKDENDKSLGSILRIGGLIGLFVDTVTILGWLFGNLSVVLPFLITTGLIISVSIANYFFEGNTPFLRGSLFEPKRILYLAIVLLPSSYFVFFMLSLLYQFGIDFSILFVSVIIIILVSLGAGFFLEIKELLEALSRLLKTSVFMGVCYIIILVPLPLFYSARLAELIPDGDLEYARQLASREAVFNNLFFMEDLIHVGKAYDAIGDFDTAISIYYDGIEIAPENIFPYIALANAKLEKNEPLSAVNIANTAIRRQANIRFLNYTTAERETKMEIYTVLGKAYLEQNDLYLARDALDTAINFESSPIGFFDYFLWDRFTEPYYYRAVVGDALGEPDYCAWKFVFERAPQNTIEWLEAKKRFPELSPPSTSCLD